MRLPLALLPAIIVFLQATSAWAQATTPVVDFPPFDSAACVAKPQRLLIIDMKSGWWSGDGEEFHDVLLPRIVKDCPQVEIEYYFLQHLDPDLIGSIPGAPGAPIPSLPPGTTIPGLPPGTPIPGAPVAPAPGLPGLVPTGPVGFQSAYPEKPDVSQESLMENEKFPSRPLNQYQQVWLLSGGDHDPLDWPTDSPSFQSLLAKFVTPAAAPGQSVPSLFLAGGTGHFDHANQVLRALGLPEMFKTHLTELTTPRVGDGSQVKVLSRARMGDGLTAHPVFEGVSSIADRMDAGGCDCDTDFLPVANHPFQIVGRNRLGEPSIALRETETRRVVIDAGMMRYYSLFDPAERDTYRFLQNTIKWLAR